MRLIDADLLKGIPIKDKLERNYQTFNLDDAYEEGWFDAIEMIEKQPTVDIVYCKDCKYGSRDPFDMRPIWCICCDHYRNKTDFCSRGEREDE